MNLMLTYFFSRGKTNTCGVLVGLYGNINYSVKKKLSDNSGRILVLDVTIDGTEYLLINLYSGNTVPEQFKILKSLSNVLKEFQDIKEKSIIFAGDFNLFFDGKLESVGENPILKKLDHSPLFCSFPNLSNISRGRGLWKFNNSLISNSNSVDEMKTLIQKFICCLENDTYLTDRVKWESLKYEIRKLAVNFSRKLAQNSRKLQTDLETKIRNLEQNLTDEDKFNKYKTEKDELEDLYDNIAT